jgi:PAS domain-containing protein
MSTPGKHQEKPPDGGSALRAFLSYRGAAPEQFGDLGNTVPRAVDILVLALLGIILIRNSLIAPHPLAWLVGGFFAAYAGLLVRPPVGYNNWRIMFFAVLTLSMSILVPLRTGDHVLVTAYVACLGAMALFFVRGTLAAGAMSLVYIVFVAIALSRDTAAAYPTSYIVAAIVSLVGIITVALLLWYHFMVRLELTNRRLAETAAALQQSLDSLEFSSVAGGVGLWDYDPETDRWHVNEVFRQIADLPYAQYPTLKSEDVVQRLPDEVREQILARIRGDEDQDVEQLEVVKSDGSRILCQGMSRFYALPGTKPIRHGMLVEMKASSEAS